MRDRGSIYFPTWLLDDLQAGLPPVQERLKAMRMLSRRRLILPFI
ncbi:hypothetical protein COCOBI_pt-2190 (chloroplast) [Coccomyxa sp. Obi]|nr:hypothetical protein COCOBI_pt-2190 [Coccomyxa sp. Obi]